MNKLSFSQKNDLVVKHKAKKHFGKDLVLFQKHLPSDRLMNELGRATEFAFERLDGQMLYLLLDKVSIEDILSNRESKEQPEALKQQEQQATLDVLAQKKLEELSNRLEALKEDVEINESDISDLQSALEDKDASIEELQSKIEGLEQKSQKKRELKLKNSPP